MLKFSGYNPRCFNHNNIDNDSKLSTNKTTKDSNCNPLGDRNFMKEKKKESTLTKLTLGAAATSFILTFNEMLNQGPLKLLREKMGSDKLVGVLMNSTILLGLAYIVQKVAGQDNKSDSSKK